MASEPVSDDQRQRWLRASHKEWDCTLCHRVHTIPVGAPFDPWTHGLERDCVDAIPSMNDLSARPLYLKCWSHVP